MHREEIRKLIGKTQVKGLTLIPNSDLTSRTEKLK